MPLFLWKKSYEINIDGIDDQHRQLVGIINELSDAMMVQKGYMSVPHTLDKLVDYIQFHFTTEEESMRKANYPALNKHCREHLAITRKILDFKANYSKNAEINSGEVLNFLCDWLKEHIVVSDNDFGAHVRGAKRKLQTHLETNEAGD